MGKTFRHDPRDSEPMILEPMTLKRYTADEDEQTFSTEIVQAFDRIKLGDLFRRNEQGTRTEAWVFEQGDNKGEFRCLVTVERNGQQIANRVLSLPESALTGMELAGFQDPSEYGIPEVVEAVG